MALCLKPVLVSSKAPLTGNTQLLQVIRKLVINPSSSLATIASNDVKNNHSDTSASVPKDQQISKAMKAYLERAQKHDAFMKQQIHEFELGKRHLANMMGKDPEFFTQEDIDESIAYLFPSGLFDPRARPFMRHPEEVFPKRKDAEFDISGRPFHSLFYSTKPNFYQVLHDAVSKMRSLDAYEDKMVMQGRTRDSSLELSLAGSAWVTQDQLEKILVESLKENNYNEWLKTMDRLAQHPYAYRAKEFIFQYRKPLATQDIVTQIPQLLYNEAGKPYITATGLRKWATAQVKVTGQGKGSVSINGRNLNYFSSIQEKEQVIFPLQFTGLLKDVDVEATVEGSGPCSQAGAVRHGISLALRSFVDKEMIEKMRLAGLLTKDYRIRERKKPGQEGARRKFTWKRR